MTRAGVTKDSPGAVRSAGGKPVRRRINEVRAMTVVANKRWSHVDEMRPQRRLRGTTEVFTGAGGMVVLARWGRRYLPPISRGGAETGNVRQKPARGSPKPTPQHFRLASPLRGG